MNILFASSEMVPYSKTGGLADVSGALPESIAANGHNVICMTPLYSDVTKKGFKLVDTGKQLTCLLGENKRTGRLLMDNEPHQAKRYFIGNESYFDRNGLYQSANGDYPDNAERFIFFSKAILEASKALDFVPDIIHLNDWQTALVAVLLKVSPKKDKFFHDTKTLLTIHNLAFQGVFWHWDWPLLNIDWKHFGPAELEFYEKINFLKGGIVFADGVNTVSKRYAKEIQGEENGAGLEGVLMEHSPKLSGILNGIDPAIWNPSIDTMIARNFTPKDPSGKKLCKRDLQKAFGLPEKADAPLFGMITRLTEQKGVELIIDAIGDFIKLKAQMVILGTGDALYEEALVKIASEKSGNIAVKIAYNDTLAHKIEAGCDFFLMPSRFEPCGLNQMYSLMYGTVPVVRATGGLDDTVTNFSEKTGSGNGIKFRDFSVEALRGALKKAVKLYSNPKLMHQLIENTFDADHSWNRSAKEYVKLYKKLSK